MLDPVGPGEDDHQPVLVRMSWFAGIALVSVLAVAAVAYALRAVLFIH
ncbi:MAG: hypothetical protein KDA53_03920 [Hyphomonas sp.]|nr:hypothetical protein [Hyphomonas sp.]